jgi:Ca-activated chloride channel family protein
MDPAEMDAILPPTVIGGVPYGLSLSADIAAESAIRSISCPSFPIEVSIHGRKAMVRLAGADRQLDQDFVLDIELATPGKAGATACRDGDGYALMLRFKPILPESARPPRDVVFIVDRSGSMAGESMAEARAALLLGLRSLREGDRFDVIGFGSGMEKVFNGPVEYNQDNLDRAVAAVGGWDADLGGTEILAPLESALGNAARGRLLSVLLLTDGEVGNEAEVIALAGKHRAHARVFSFGIGRGASGSLIRGVARASGGMAEFIFPGERIEPKVLRQMARLSSPVVQAARLDWGGLEPEVSLPAELPAFCSGDELDILCRVPRITSARVRLLEEKGAEIAECVIDDEMVVSGDSTVALLLARELIGWLEEGGDAGGSAQNSRKAGSRDRRILEIALKYGLVSSRTSFVAVEERTGEDKGSEVSLRRVPVALTRGWGGTNYPQGAAMPAMAFSCGAGPDRSVRAKKAAPHSVPCEISEYQADALVSDRFMDLVGLQRVKGFWMMTPELLALAGSLGTSLTSSAPEPLREPERFATLLALFLLWTEFCDREDEWRLIADKALAWLKTEGIEPVRPASRGTEFSSWMAAMQA